MPATNSPIAVTRAFGLTSSARYAVAEAGTPARAAPWSARSATRAPSDGAKGTSSPTVTATAREAVITVRRPYRSDSALIGSTNTARPPVAAATVQLASPALTPRSPEISGSRACVEYSSAKVATPARNRAKLIRRKPGPPGEMRESAPPGALGTSGESGTSGASGALG
ncbi:hypothetical protein SHIRM173S_01126 [Streptomyces hirsutus]